MRLVLMCGAQRATHFGIIRPIFSRRFERTKAVIRALQEGSAYGVTLSSG
jgi:hypothetical protein